MKLTSAIHSASVELSEEAFLRAENDFLRAELKLKDLEHSLELIETILDCIKAEGSVSSSIETMFGENFTSKSTAQKELEDIHASIENSFIDSLFSASKKMMELLRSTEKRLVEVAKKYSSQELGFPIEVTIPRIAHGDKNEEDLNLFYSAFKDPSDDNIKKLQDARVETPVEAKCATIGNWGSFVHDIIKSLEGIEFKGEQIAKESDETLKKRKSMVVRLYERALLNAARAFIASGNKLIAGKA